MNLFAGTVGKAEDGGFSGALAVQVGNQRLVLDPAVVAAHPAGARAGRRARHRRHPSGGAQRRGTWGQARRSARCARPVRPPVASSRRPSIWSSRWAPSSVVHVEVTDIPPLGADPSGSWRGRGLQGPGRGPPRHPQPAGGRRKGVARGRHGRPAPVRRRDRGVAATAPTSRPPAWRAASPVPDVSPAAPAGPRRRRSRHGTPARPPMSEPVLVAGLDVGGTKTLAVAIVADRGDVVARTATTARRARRWWPPCAGPRGGRRRPAAGVDRSRPRRPRRRRRRAGRRVRGGGCRRSRAGRPGGRHGAPCRQPGPRRHACALGEHLRSLARARRRGQRREPGRRRGRSRPSGAGATSPT